MSAEPKFYQPSSRMTLRGLASLAPGGLIIILLAGLLGAVVSQLDPESRNVIKWLLPVVVATISALRARIIAPLGVAGLLVYSAFLSLVSLFIFNQVISYMAAGGQQTDYAIAAVTFLLTLFALRFRQGQYYCHNCANWCTGERAILAFYSSQDENLTTYLSRGDLSFLDAAEPILTEPFQDYYLICEQLCEQCNDFFIVNGYRVRKSSNFEKGRRKALFRGLELSRAAYQHLLFEKPRFPPPLAD